MTTIRLYGKMGALFGRVHHVHLSTNSPAEAVAYLRSQFRGVDKYLGEAHKKGVGFAVFRGKENLARDQLTEPVSSDDIRIAPILMGSKQGGTLQVIVGVVLIVVGAVLDVYGYAPAGNALIKAGVVMVAGGIVQMLTPVPKMNKNKDGPGNQASYDFNGAVNTQAQGNPVPFGYGRMRVGSAVISAGIHAEDYTPRNYIDGSGTIIPPTYPKGRPAQA